MLQERYSRFRIQEMVVESYMAHKDTGNNASESGISDVQKQKLEETWLGQELVDEIASIGNELYAQQVLAYIKGQNEWIHGDRKELRKRGYSTEFIDASTEKMKAYARCFVRLSIRTQRSIAALETNAPT